METVAVDRRPKRLGANEMRKRNPFEAANKRQ
jgi:hypothetical protein